MTRPQTWDWTESLTDDTPPSARPAASWIAQEVFRPDVVQLDASWPDVVRPDAFRPDVFRPAEEQEAGPEPSLAEFAAELSDTSTTVEPGEDESGEVELAEWESAASPAAFPSGLTLSPGTGATGKNAEHWDPNYTGLPLYATGPAVRTQKIAANFTVGELVSSGGTAADNARIDPVLVRALQALRDRLGKPVTVSSGYRSWARNVAVYRARGATPTLSRHCSGQAADISVAGMAGLDLAKAALDACGPTIALGIGAAYIHLDVRGTWARWSYATGAAASRDVAAIDAYRAALGKAPAAPPAGGTGGGPLRARIVQLAGQEAARWSGHSETESAMTATLQDYYSSGVGITVPAADLQSSSWQSGHPWSAVFISWVMRQAGAGAAFAYSTAHREYISAAKRNAESGDTGNPFWAYPLEKVVAEVGDLVCADRETDGRCGGVTYATIDNGTAWSTHCDVVTAVDRAGRTVTAVGGNVSNAVKSKTIATDAQGFVIPAQAGQTCRFFAIIKLREGAPANGRADYAKPLSEDEVSRANRLNAAYAPAMGWAPHLAAVSRLVSSPGPAHFAQAVAGWQRAQGLTPDGVIGPNSWTEMSKVL